jgi:DNA-binding FadR family transcriptional regulator
VPSRAASGGDNKLAARVADRIIEDVMAQGWPVGEVLGAEAELLERYGVSRAVFREAVRLVEHREVARTRRGPGGGLVITEPSVEAVIDAVVLYLHRVDARLDEVFEARIILEEIATDLACRRLDEHDLTRLRSYVEKTSIDYDKDPRTLHRYLAACSRNPAIELFVEVLNRVAMLYSSGWKHFGLGAETLHAHSRIAEAVMAGDSGLARRRMRAHLEAEADYLRRRRSTRQLLPDAILADHAGSGKLAEAVARRITQSVITLELDPGDLVGTETELIDQAGVSRAVFREAVRLLEYHQVARMRRGPGGGLFVMEPSAVAVTDIAAIYLARRKMELGQLSEMRTALEVSIVELAVDRLDESGRARIKAALERETTVGEGERAQAVHDLHAALAAATSNRVLELVTLVLIRLSRLHQVERLARKEIDRIRAEVLRTHTAIAAAVMDGDRDLARHRMHKHMEALAAVVR